MVEAAPGDSRDSLLRTLHDAHATALYHFVLRLTDQPQLSQDIVQETLLQAWQHPEVMRGPAPRPWLYTVARNRVIDHYRSARARREIGTDQPPEVSIADRADTIIDTCLVADALRELSDDHRRVLVHAFYAGASTADLAKQLGVSINTAKSRLHYGLRALQLALQEKGVTHR